MKEDPEFHEQPLLHDALEPILDKNRCPHQIPKWFFCAWCRPDLTRTAERVRDDIHLQEAIETKERR